MKINSNLMANKAHQKYTINTKEAEKSAKKLASGYRVNGAGDDAAGLAISEKMRSQIFGLMTASRNSSDAVSFVQTADGALQQSQDVLNRMRELAVQGSSDLLTDSDRANLNAELKQLAKELDSSAQTTKFNDMGVIDGSFSGQATVNGAQAEWLTPGTAFKESGAYSLSSSLQDGVFSLSLTDSNNTVVGSLSITQQQLQALDIKAGDEVRLQLNDGTAIRFTAAADPASGFNEGDQLNTLERLDNMANATDVLGGSAVSINWDSAAFTVQAGANQGDTMHIGIAGMSAKSLGVDTLTLADSDSARQAISRIDDALKTVSSQRSDLGAVQNRLEEKISNINTSAENLASAESRIRDLDFAMELMNRTKSKILSQASTAVLAQANTTSGNVLRLLG